METPWILSNPLVSQIILPFLLVFVLVFAILDRSKILGEDKRQINAIISLAIGLIFVTFSKAVGIVVNLMPFLAVVAVIILVFMILYGFVASDKDGLKIPKGIKIAGGIVVILALVIAVVVVTGYWDPLVNMFSGGSSNSVVSTIIFLVVAGAAVAVVVSMGKKD